MPQAQRRRLVALGMWLLLLAACAAVIAQTRFSADLSAFLPAAPDARQQLLIDQLHSGTPARTLIAAIEGGTATERSGASQRLADALRASGRFEQVLNGDNAAFAALGQWVFERRYLLSPAVDAAHFQSAGLRDAIADTLSLLGTPAGAAVKPLLERDPTGETQRIAEAALASDGPRLIDGLWASRDGQRALLMMQTRAAGADIDAQEATLAFINQQFKSVAGTGLNLLLSGAPKFAVDSRAQIESEVRFLAIAGTLLMGGLLLLAFGSIAALGVAMLPVASAVVAGIAAVSLGFGTVHGITLGFGTTLIGEAVDYAIYFLIQAHARSNYASREGNHGTGWQRWVRDGWPTVRLGLLTSVCGFLALAFSGFAGLAQLGVFSIAGLFAAALTTRYVLPVLMPDGAKGVGLRRQLGRISSAAAVALPRGRHAFTALALAAAALLTWQHDKLWSNELSSLSPVPRAALQLDEQLRAELSSSEAAALVVVQGADAQTTLRNAERVAARLDQLVDAGRIAGFDSVTRLLPSLATQAQRRAALPDAPTLQAALDEATQGGPLRAQRLGPFVAAVQSARALPDITPEAIQGGPAAPLVNALLTRASSGGWTALMPLHAADGKVDTAAVQQALAGLSNAQLLDVGSELGLLYRHYLSAARGQALLGALGVVLLMALWLRSGRRLLAVCQPLAVAVLLVMAALALLHVQLGILHLVGLLLVVAVGSNYALFFDLLQRSPGADEDDSDEDDADEDTLASLLLANLTTVLSFGLIALSGIPALSAIGCVVAPGALLALLLSAAYMPKPPQSPV